MVWLLDQLLGIFQALSGAHRIRITKDGYRNFERDVNVFDNAEFSVSLEKTEAQDRSRIEAAKSRCG